MAQVGRVADLFDRCEATCFPLEGLGESSKDLWVIRVFNRFARRVVVSSLSVAIVVVVAMIVAVAVVVAVVIVIVVLIIVVVVVIVVAMLLRVWLGWRCEPS